MRYPAGQILLIATRQIGDVLLVTPLLRSLRRAYPSAQIDVLVYRRTGGMLEGNPDLDAMIEVDEHPDRDGYRVLLRQILRRYDLAISTLHGDRPSIYAFIAAPRRVSIVPDRSIKAAWKRWVAAAWTVLDNINTHTVVQNLRLADLLAIPRCYEVVPPSRADATERLQRLLPFHRQVDPYVVMHAMPMWRYKRWPREAWGKLATHLHQQGFWVVLTGGPAAEERASIRVLSRSLAPIPVVDLAGKLSFGDLSELIRSCACYVGPDTCVTHLAAACGAPTVAIYGPTNPVKWGPWPVAYCSEPSPYALRGAWQRRGNVLLLQDVLGCVPCLREGCERHKKSYSHCLDQLPAARVFEAVQSLLAEPVSSVAKRCMNISACP